MLSEPTHHNAWKEIAQDIVSIAGIIELDKNPVFIIPDRVWNALRDLLLTDTRNDDLIGFSHCDYFGRNYRCIFSNGGSFIKLSGVENE